MAIVIRHAELSDAPLIVEFSAALAMESEDKVLPPNVLRRGVETGIARRELCRYYVAEIDGRVVGQIMVTFEWSDWRNGMFWWIQSVYVHPDFRRRGVFTRLFRHVETLARSENACGLRLYVECENDVAQKTYSSLGLGDTAYRVMECDWSERCAD